jgi:hypothetical protein
VTWAPALDGIVPTLSYDQENRLEVDQLGNAGAVRLRAGY